MIVIVPYIRVWALNSCVFIDLVNGSKVCEFKRFYKGDFHNFVEEVSFHLNRLRNVTRYSVTNETDLCLDTT